MHEHDFNVFVGSQNGFFKGINLNKKAIITKNFSKNHSSSTPNKQITSISWNDSNQDEIMVGFQHQQIAIFDTTSNCFSWSHCHPFGEGSLISVFQKSGCIISGLDSGEVRLYRHQQSTIIKTFARDYSDRNTKKPTLCCVKPDLLNTSQFATGGCENDLALWDINNPAIPIFRAKNIKADMLRLRVPIWITDLTYLPDSNLIAISSRHNHLRLYDPRAQRKPVINFEWENNPLTCITAVPSAERQVVVGTSYGRMALYDLRSPSVKTPVRSYKDFIGAVKSVTVNESSPLVLSVSLDRFLRVHHLQTGSVLYKHFLKSRPNCLIARKDLNDNDFDLAEKIARKPIKSQKKHTKSQKKPTKRKAPKKCSS